MERGGLCLFQISLFCNALLSVLFSFAIISPSIERELVALL